MTEALFAELVSLGFTRIHLFNNLGERGWSCMLSGTHPNGCIWDTIGGGLTAPLAIANAISLARWHIANPPLPRPKAVKHTGDSLLAELGL